MLHRARVPPRQAFLFVAVALAVSALAGVASAGPEARVAAEPAPVASLEPAATEKLWRKLVARPHGGATRAQQDCRPLRAVFYAATDYLRLATKLAEKASPCAEYYISVPPIVADKTQPRRDAARRIRALGPNFHAMAEFHFATWTRWVASTGSSWFTAGVTARERMAAAGYDFANGDTWVVNEATSAVRRGIGNARANLRELLRGLYEGDGSRPARGAVFVIGVGQRTGDVSQYQTTFQNWMSDAAFWADMNTYVSDWSQEVYGDVRNWAVAGIPEETRRDYLNDYLQHGLVLANAAPPTVQTAKSYLQASYSPLGNAAWERASGYGWTMVPPEQMAGYVSSQVHAMRYFSASTGQPQDHWGLAWAPRNGSGYAAPDFAAKTALILDRLATAIRDSAVTTDPEDPGSAACGPLGQNLACVADLEGSRLNEAWKSFRTWTQPVLAFATPPQTLPAGTPSAAMTLALTSPTGQPVVTRTALTVGLSSTSPQGTFSTSPLGPWSPTLSVEIPADSGTSGAFYYLDTRAGVHTLTASATGATSGTQTVTITPGPAVSLAVTPASATVRARGTRELSAFGVDSYGNRFPVSAAWSLAPASVGTVSPTAGSTTTFTASRRVGRATLTAVFATENGSMSGAARVTVTPGRLRVALRWQVSNRTAFVAVRAVDGAGSSISRARVFLVVRRNGRAHFTKLTTTGPAGRVSVRVPIRRGGCFLARVARATALGFAWDGRTRAVRLCRRPR